MNASKNVNNESRRHTTQHGTKEVSNQAHMEPRKKEEERQQTEAIN